MKKLSIVLSLAMVLGFTTLSNATLWDRGGGLIYDDYSNITWLQDAGMGGLKVWNDAMNWAANLSYYDSVRGVTYDDWRLPTTPSQGGPGYCYGFNCTGTEMGHLYYTELKNVANGTSTNTGPFINMERRTFWSSTEYGGSPPAAWEFSFWNGIQINGNKSYPVYAWAVRDGDVAPVPIPAAIWLMGAGLVGLVGVRRRFRI